MAYKFSLPTIGDLSHGQKIALNAQAEDVFIISGCPGSGKTTVALLRAKGRGSNPRFHYTVWAQMLYGYLLNLAPELGVSENHFSTFYSWFFNKHRVKVFVNGGIDTNAIVNAFKRSGMAYDEIQLDEGQDLPLPVRTALSLITNKLVICMDPAQDVQGTCEIDKDEIQLTLEVLRDLGKNPLDFKLTTNWRNTKAIFDFAKNIIPELNSQINVFDFAKERGAKPTLHKVYGQDNIVRKIIEIIENEPGRNIGILSDSLQELHEIERELTRAKIKSTLYDTYEQRRRSSQEKKKFLTSMNSVILCTYISCKGLEFNTVIMSDLSSLSDDLKKKKGYYVGCTRAQDRLVFFLDTSKQTVPDWFQQIDKDFYNIRTENITSNPY
jgi:DNA helicase IV